MITTKQKFSLIYFLTNSFFLASGYSLIFKTSGKDSWVSMLIGMLIGIIFILIINNYCFNHKKNYLLNTKQSLINKLISLSFFFFLLFINLLILRIFVTSFLLTKTPGLFITLPFIFLALYNSSKGVNNIAKTAEILMPISLAIIIITILSVIKDGDINYFLPLITTKKYSLIKSSFYFSIFTVIPNSLLFDIKIDLKNHLKSYVISSLVSLFIGIFIIYVLGPYLIKVFRFPEYMVLKQIKVFNFIEKIENLVGLIWIFNLFISASISLYNVNKIIKNNKFMIFFVVLVPFLVEFISSNYNYAISIYKNLPLLLFIIGSLFLFSLYRIMKKIKKVASAT